MTALGNKEIMAKNLKYYIEKSGKDRRELAEIWGFPYSTVTEWINGKKYPRIDKIEIMADYFGILISDLVEDKSKLTRAVNDMIATAEASRKKEPAPTNGNGLSMYDAKVLNWFRSLSEEKRQAILALGDAPEELRGEPDREQSARNAAPPRTK